MKTLTYFYLSCSSLLTGMIFFAFYHQWIILNLPSRNVQYQQLTTQKPTRKNTILYYWHNESWHSEKTDLLWSQNKSQTISHLIANWLNLLDEEHITTKPITIQTALLSSSGDIVYLSFDRNPLPKQATTFEKWLFIEGLLRTLRENGVSVNQVQFLVRHQLMQDEHLDFSNPWQISGFYEN